MYQDSNVSTVAAPWRIEEKAANIELILIDKETVLHGLHAPRRRICKCKPWNCIHNIVVRCYTIHNKGDVILSTSFMLYATIARLYSRCYVFC